MSSVLQRAGEDADGAMNSGAVDEVPPPVKSGEPDWVLVKRELVHKLRSDAVLVTGYLPLGRDVFELTGTWPRRHGFYAPEGDQPDALMVMETLRQAIIVIAHLGYTVPMTSRFTMKSVGITLKEETGLQVTADVPVTIRVHTRALDVRSDQLRAMKTDLEFYSGTKRVASGTGDLIILPVGSYRRVRNDRQPRPFHSELPRLGPERVKRRSPGDVVIGGAPRSLHLVVDTAHPYLFDHAADHVPGMVLLEGARQAFHDLDPIMSAIAGVHGTFHRFVELDDEVQVLATHRGHDVALRILAEGEEAAEITISAFGRDRAE